MFKHGTDPPNITVKSQGDFMDQQVTERIPKARVLKAANAFLNTAEKINEVRPEGIDWIYPLSVNSGLAMELYLKAYLARNNDVLISTFDDGASISQRFFKSISRKHKLEELYLEIDQVIRADLEGEFSKSDLNKKYESLPEALGIFSNIFVEGRYPYEKGGFSGGFDLNDLLRIPQFLKLSIESLGYYNIDS